MVSIYPLVLVVFLRHVLGWTLFEPLDWSRVPNWSCYTIEGVTLGCLLFIDVNSKRRPQLRRIGNRKRYRLAQKLKLLQETVVSFALLDIVTHGVWCRLFLPVIHFGVRSLCVYMGMSASQYLERERFHQALASTTVAWMLCNLLFIVLRRYRIRDNK